MAQNSMSTIITLGIFGAAAYALYEWLNSECATAGSMFYGGSICSTLGIPGTTAAAAAPAATSAAPIVATTPPAAASVTVPTATLSSKLQAWANANGFGPAYTENSGDPPGQLNSDHWNAIYQIVTGALADSNTMNAVFWPNGRPASIASYPVYTAQQFVQMLAASGNSAYAGLSGLSANRVPMGLIHRGAW